MRRRGVLLGVGVTVSGAFAGCTDFGSDDGVDPAACPPTTLEEAETLVADPEDFSHLETFAIADGSSLYRNGETATADTVTAYYLGPEEDALLLRLFVWESTTIAVEHTPDETVTAVIDGDTRTLTASAVGQREHVTLVVYGIDGDAAGDIETLFDATGCFSTDNISRRRWE